MPHAQVCSSHDDVPCTAVSSTYLPIGLGLFGPGSNVDFEKFLGFNRAGRRSKIEIFSE